MQKEPPNPKIMKNKPTPTDAATPTAYSDGIKVTELHFSNGSIYKIVEILRAVNLLAAHEAVAEALKLFTEDHHPKLTAGGLCTCCGNWTPHWHPEKHDHKDNCEAQKAYLKLVDTRDEIAEQALAHLAKLKEEME